LRSRRRWRIWRRSPPACWAEVEHVVHISISVSFSQGKHLDLQHVSGYEHIRVRFTGKAFRPPY
jgi:hypothetical protein